MGGWDTDSVGATVGLSCGALAGAASAPAAWTEPLRQPGGDQPAGRSTASASTSSRRRTSAEVAAMSRTGVVVVGSANVDLVLPVPRIPRPARRCSAAAATRDPGGKGANQAVAAARAGARTVARGARRRRRRRSCCSRRRGAPAWTSRWCAATSATDRYGHHHGRPDGENSIVVAPGANAGVLALTTASARGQSAAASRARPARDPARRRCQAAADARPARTSSSTPHRRPTCRAALLGAGRPARGQRARGRSCR